MRTPGQTCSGEPQLCARTLNLTICPHSILTCGEANRPPNLCLELSMPTWSLVASRWSLAKRSHHDAPERPSDLDAPHSRIIQPVPAAETDNSVRPNAYWL